MGQLDKVENVFYTEQYFFQPYDVIGFIHTGGVIDAQHPPIINDAYQCIAIADREYNAQHGGVAVYVRKNVMTLIQDVVVKPQLGIVWVQIGSNHRNTMVVGFLYLPPNRSTYYTQDGGVDEWEHWEVLEKDVKEYMSKGAVVVMGDFNARTGELHEGRNGWDMCQQLHVRDTGFEDGFSLNRLCERVSCDAGLNDFGKRLIKMCYSCDMAIVNGRTAGDSRGEYTFQTIRKHGQQPMSSVIDYAVASRDLFKEDGEMVKDGVAFNVIGFDECPLRDYERHGRFDHKPICMTVPWEYVESGEGGEVGYENDKGEATVVYRWKPEIQGAYADALMTDGEVMRLLQVVKDPLVGVTESEACFMSAISRACVIVDEKLGGVIKKSNGRTNQAVKKHKQPWYTEECAHLRRSMKEDERRYGMGSQMVAESRRRYRACTKRCKAEYRKKAVRNRMDQLRKEPKLFWKWYGGIGADKAKEFGLKRWTSYFKDLLHIEGDGGGRADLHCDAHQSFFGQPTQEDVNAASELNQPFQPDEIVAAIKSLGNNKAPGYDGIPGEFLKNAFWEEVGQDGLGRVRILRHYILLESLVCLFNKMYTSDEYPNTWSTGVLTPIPKGKGDPRVMDNYRGITVGGAMSKIYALVLMNRLKAWAESNGKRSGTQFGFRDKVGTCEAMFVLDHIIQRSNVEEIALFTAFIDFWKAYDCVDREVLWRSLQNQGIHGHCLSALRRMYESVTIRVKENGQIGEAFQTNLGVKQGDPLSPLLFGLFIDRFEKFLRDKVPDAGVCIEGRRIQVLFYADDLVIIAKDANELQRCLDALEQFCDTFRLVVNSSKSEIVVFNEKWAGEREKRRVGWRYKGEAIQRSYAFNYLGMRIGDEILKKKARLACHARVEKARRALFAMVGKCNDAKIYNPSMKCRLYDTLVMPVLSYGCEVWSPLLVAEDKETMVKGEAEELHRKFMRMNLWVNKSTPVLVMMEELARYPTVIHWMKRCVKFWNKLNQCQPDSILARVLNDSWNLHCMHDEGWVNSFVKMCRKMSNCADEIHLGMRIDDKSDFVIERWHKASWEKAIRREDIPIRAWTDTQREGFKFAKYKSWFGGNLGRCMKGACDEESRHFTDVVATCTHVRNIAGYRCGSSWLNCETMRCKKVARSERYCQLCEVRGCEDEAHVMVCDAYEDIRRNYVFFSEEKYTQLKDKFLNGEVGMEFDKNMREFFLKRDAVFWNDWGDFLSKSRKIREGIMIGSS